MLHLLRQTGATHPGGRYPSMATVRARETHMSGVKAGIMVSNQQFEGVDMVSALEEQIVMVRLARDRGWDSFFSGQHYLNEGGNQGLQMVPYLARLAADAGDMTLGVGLLLLPLHNPVYTAETIATLDVISRRAAQLGDCLYHSPKATLATHKERLTLYKEELRKAGKPLPRENPCRIEIYCA